MLFIALLHLHPYSHIGAKPLARTTSNAFTYLLRYSPSILVNFVRVLEGVYGAEPYAEPTAFA